MYLLCRRSTSCRCTRCYDPGASTPACTAPRTRRPGRCRSALGSLWTRWRGATPGRSPGTLSGPLGPPSPEGTTLPRPAPRSTWRKRKERTQAMLTLRLTEIERKYMIYECKWVSLTFGWRKYQKPPTTCVLAVLSTSLSNPFPPQALFTMTL